MLALCNCFLLLSYSSINIGNIVKINFMEFFLRRIIEKKVNQTIKILNKLREFMVIWCET